MSNPKDKFAGDTTSRDRYNFIGKIIVTVVCILLCLVSVIKIYAEYKSLLIPFIVVLVFGIILATVWLKSLYIYRYMLPAAIIIAIFTAYPIVYTIFIAFTNFGTGHMQSKGESKTILTTKVWNVDYTKPSMYAEFFIAKDGQFAKYKDEYNRERQKFLSTNSADVKAALYENIREYMFDSEITNKIYNAADKEFVLSLYTLEDGEYVLQSDLSDSDYKKLVGILDSIGYIYLDAQDEWEAGILNSIINKYYRYDTFRDFTLLMYPDNYDETGIVYTVVDSGKKLSLKEISPEEIADIQAKNVIVGDQVIEREGVEKANGLYVEFFEKYYTDLYEAAPISSPNGEYLLEQSNQFYVKAHSYKVEDGKFMKLAINDDDSIGGYTIQVFEDNKDGKFALTKDNQKVRYWKEYSLLDYGNGLPGYGYEYGMMTLEKNAVAEEFLENQFKVQEIRNKIESLDLSAIAGKDVKNVSSAELANVKKQIDAVNKDIKAFNKDKNKLRAEYINGKINDVKNSSDSEAAKKKAIKSIKKENFPEIALVKLEKNDASNIDYSVQIEPGYMVTVGMNNFTKIVTNRSITTPFIKVFIWTVIWSLVSVIGSFAVGLALALVFNSSDLKGKYAYRTIFILPYAIPGFVSILMWQGFFNEDFGVINNFFNCHIPWLTTNGTMAKVSVLIVNIWMSFPYNMLISLGALQSIDSSMYEAADVDGATGPQQFWMITLPLLMIALGPMLVGSFAFAFNNFAGIYLLTGGGPVMAAGVLPGHTDILISYTYKLAFGEQNKDYGLASAIAIIVFLIIGTITFLQFKFTGTFKEVDNA